MSQKLDAKMYTFMLTNDLRERLEKVTKVTGTTMSESIRNTLDVGLDVFEIYHALGLFTIFGGKKKDLKQFVQDQLSQV